METLRHGFLVRGQFVVIENAGEVEGGYRVGGRILAVVGLLAALDGLILALDGLTLVGLYLVHFVSFP
jgi:hypothetical protein